MTSLEQEIEALYQSNHCSLKTTLTQRLKKNARYIKFRRYRRLHGNKQMIDLLIGSDNHAIQKNIASLKANLNKTWALCNYHQFNGSDIENAIRCALSPALGTTEAKLIVVENCDFKQIDSEMFFTLELIANAKHAHLVLWGTSIDKRLKAAKFLLGCANLSEFDLMPPWRIDLIAAKINSEATRLKLKLDKKVIEYLANAIGNDLTRVETELQKLLTYSASERITLAEVQMLVSCSTQNSLQLAEAIRTGKAKEVATLLEELLARNNHPMIICATLITQFRTWLWVKSALNSGVKQDAELAKICGIGNPKRIYFLKQEVQHASQNALKDAIKKLLDLEISLKSGRRSEHLLPSILSVTRLFS